MVANCTEFAAALRLPAARLALLAAASPSPVASHLVVVGVVVVVVVGVVVVVVVGVVVVVVVLKVYNFQSSTLT